MALSKMLYLLYYTSVPYTITAMIVLSVVLSFQASNYTYHSNADTSVCCVNVYALRQKTCVVSTKLIECGKTRQRIKRDSHINEQKKSN